MDDKEQDSTSSFEVILEKVEHVQTLVKNGATGKVQPATTENYIERDRIACATEERMADNTHTSSTTSFFGITKKVLPPELAVEKIFTSENHFPLKKKEATQLQHFLTDGIDSNLVKKLIAECESVCEQPEIDDEIMQQRQLQNDPPFLIKLQNAEVNRKFSLPLRKTKMTSHIDR